MIYELNINGDLDDFYNKYFGQEEENSDVSHVKNELKAILSNHFKALEEAHEIDPKQAANFTSRELNNENKALCLLILAQESAEKIIQVSETLPQNKQTLQERFKEYSRQQEADDSGTELDQEEVSIINSINDIDNIINDHENSLREPATALEFLIESLKKSMMTNKEVFNQVEIYLGHNQQPDSPTPSASRPQSPTTDNDKEIEAII